MADLRAKYDEVAGNFEAFLTEAEGNRDELDRDLKQLMDRVAKKQGENDELKRRVEENEGAIHGLEDESTGLTADIEKIKSTHEATIRGLEQDRARNESLISDLKKKAADTEHEFQKCQIEIERMKNEIDYINKEQEKFRSQSYAEKVEKFKDYIEDSNRKTQKMRDDLDALKREWDQKLARAAQRTESLLGATTKAGKLDELAAELRAKQGELSALESRRGELERQLKNADGSKKEAEIRELREGLADLNKQFLEILEEKNRMFEDLTTQTKELLTLNGQIQAYAQDQARYNQELEFLRREFTEKDKIIGNLQAEIEEKEARLAELKEEWEAKQRELDELQNALRDALSEGKELDAMIDERDVIIADLEN